MIRITAKASKCHFANKLTTPIDADRMRSCYVASMEVKYRSTRGGVSGVSFQEALLSGFAPDGGLFVPERLPKFSSADIKSWANLTYPQLIEKFTRFFISRQEVTDQEISGIYAMCGEDHYH